MDRGENRGWEKRFGWVGCLLGLGSVMVSHLSVPVRAESLDEPRVVAFVGVDLVSMVDDQVVEDQTVVVAGEMIAAIGNADTIAVPDGAVIVEAHGSFLLPGLIDLHAHPYRREEMPLFLANGVTRILVPGGSLSLLKWRDEPHGMEPRLHVCGPSLNHVREAHEAVAIVREQAADGYDCIKIYDDISAEAFGALAREAKEQGLLSIGHIPRNLTWNDMLDAGPSAVAHAEEFLYSPCCSAADLERIQRTMRESGTALIATISNYDRIGRQAADAELYLATQPTAFYSPVLLRTWIASRNGYRRNFGVERLAKLRFLLDFQKLLVKRLADAGVRVLAGTDAGNPGSLPGFSIHDELAALEGAGLSRFAVLTAATRHAADFLGIGDRVGTVEVGKRADLLLVWGNPLKDLGHLKLPYGVMVGGEWSDRAEQTGSLRRLRADLGPEREFVDLLEGSGWAASLDWYRERLQRELHPPLAMAALNEASYQTWKIDGELAEAIEGFRLNAAAYPDSWAVHDSLGEALEAAGQRAAALRAYRRSVALEPRNRQAVRRIEDLEDQDP